jgi:hypothetical protein
LYDVDHFERSFVGLGLGHMEYSINARESFWHKATVGSINVPSDLNNIFIIVLGWEF